MTSIDIPMFTYLAYIGPGGAISSIGAFLALLAAVVLAVIGFLWYPLKRFFRRRRQGSPKTPVAVEPASDGTDMHG